jgi:hypothetical protein
MAWGAAVWHVRRARGCTDEQACQELVDAALYGGVKGYAGISERDPPTTDEPPLQAFVWERLRAANKWRATKQPVAKSGAKRGIFFVRAEIEARWPLADRSAPAGPAQPPPSTRGRKATFAWEKIYAELFIRIYNGDLTPRATSLEAVAQEMLTWCAVNLDKTPATDTMEDKIGLVLGPLWRRGK